MSQTIAPSSPRASKSVCKACNRTVYIVTIDGVRVPCDPEIQTYVPFEGAPRRAMGRRVHAEMCLKYRSEAERVRALAITRRVRPGI